MAEKMTRRTFMKSAAAAAIAVSLSGALAGCGGNDAPTYDEVNVGAFIAKVYDAKGSKTEQDDGTVTCHIKATAKLTYKGSDKGIAKHSSEFKAEMEGQRLNTTVVKNAFTVDTLVTNTRESTTDLTIVFPDVTAYEKFLNGATIILSIKIDGVSEGKLYLVKTEKEIVVVNTEPLG